MAEETALGMTDSAPRGPLSRFPDRAAFPVGQSILRHLMLLQRSAAECYLGEIETA